MNMITIITIIITMSITIIDIIITKTLSLSFCSLNIEFSEGGNNNEAKVFRSIDKK